MNTTVRTLDVPGATLHYEVRGEGPALLLICGGIYDAAGYAGLAEQLADRYTVVTYDRRGNSRSPLAGPPEPQRIDVHADDASRLLAEVADGPAFVFGNSSGAQIGLDLAARYPERVRALIAHEPPLLRMLDAGYWEKALTEVERAFREDGAGAAMGTFGAAMGMSGGEDTDSEAGGSEPTPEMREMLARFERNTGFFVGYEVPYFGRWMPDVDALRGSSARIVLAAGEGSVGEPPHEAAHALAERLGTKADTYPGDHGGFGPAADAFATRLDEVFSTS
ncbi:alpha/beta fold hydrolase [Actinomadura livida]|uniref:Alpha/beta hydrolase n=1 Tax=Actinomadura livida TaxID=79909 RepID=A0A7W7I9L5_9ACTN|nr:MULTISPECIES: alpha/beta fold hydrolase [Actinomadura]MBB4772936.1 pimeloyl-ACP methyl ester carboxylesterase [Actinomadura catellatispora]GGU13780.1 hydrolase [Actinomadura livida]